jgi:hypothetical protein
MKIRVFITLCNDSCKQLIIIDEYRAICGVSGRIFGLTSREIEAVQIFLHNECLQNIRESLVNLIVIFDLKENTNLEDKSIEELEVEAHDDYKFEQEIFC